MDTARDLMRRQVIAVSPQTSSEDAMDLLIENEVSGLPVVDSTGRILGIFSEVDRIYHGSIQDQPVEDLMSKQVLTVDVNDTWTDVVRVFRDNAVRRLPVTERGLMVGIIGLRDLVRYLRETERGRDGSSQDHSGYRGVSTLPSERELRSGNVAAETSTPLTKSFCSPQDERRQATRFQRERGTDFAVVWRQPDDEILVNVLDESLTGLGIVADTDLGLQVGSRVHVVYAGEYLDGEVVHITILPEGNYRFGLRCKRPLPEAAE